MEFFRVKKEDALHIAGASYDSPYKAEREKEERQEQEEQRTPTRRESEIAVRDRLDRLQRKSLDDQRATHDALMLRAYAIHTGQPFAPLEPTTDELVLHLQEKYELDFGTALFEFLKFTANTDVKHRILRPNRNARGRITSVTHVKDGDDRLQDVYLDVWKQEQRGDFRGVDDNGQPVNFLHWVNKIYANQFGGAVTERFEANKVSRQVYANEARQDEKKPAYDDTEDQAPKRSHGWSNESVSDGSRFSPQDIDKSKRMWEIVARLRRTNPEIAALLSQGLNLTEISKRLSIKYSKVTRLIKKVEDAIEAAGITARETGRVFRTPNKRAAKLEEVAVV